MKTILLIILTVLCIPIYSQVGPTSNWYFGNLAGITFNSGTPVALTNSALSTTEGVATISDNSGALLFYTNGVNVWNRLHLLMTNGTGLLGHTSSTQSSIIVQKPGSPNIYYIFCSDADAGPNGITYSEVNMTLSAGLGAVTINKNILLYSPSCEKLCAVRHCNNIDIWVVSHDWNTNTFRVWSVNSLGVGSITAWSNVGYIPTWISGPVPAQPAYGQLKSSFDGAKLATCYYGSSSGGNRLQLYDFNNSTGVVSNAVTLATDQGLYGCEFSPNSRILYAATNPGLLLQFDLCTSQPRTVISNAGAFIGSLQLAPDGKIYVARNTISLSVINNPNVLGLGCNYVNASLSLLGRNSSFGLPNFPSYYNQPTVGLQYSQLSCNTYDFSSIIPLSSCGSSNINSYIWDFGDGTTSMLQNPVHQFTDGNWIVTLTINNGCIQLSNTLNLNVNTGIITGPIYKQ